MKRLLLIGVLVGILLIGAFLRFYKLTSYPPGFFADEAGQAYSAYQILHTSYDFQHKFPPFFIYISGPLWPVAIYDQIPAIVLFGSNEFSARFTAALLGSATLIGVFFLTQELFHKRSVSLMALLLTAVSPWHIQFSRFAVEDIRVPLYLTLFLWLMLLGLRKNNWRYFLLSALCFMVGFYSYLATDIFFLLFLPAILFMYRNYFLKHKRILLLYVLALGVCVTSLVGMFVAYPSSNRFTAVSVFRERTFFQAATEMIHTYVMSFSPDFLFLKGDIGMPGHYITRYSVSSMGELYLITFPFLVVGIYILLKSLRRKESQVLLLWLLLYPLGSVIARGDGSGPFATRSIAGVIVFQILCAIGVCMVLSWVRQRIGTKVNRGIIYVCIAFLFLISVIAYGYQYFYIYPSYAVKAYGFQYGMKEVLYYALLHENSYDDIVFYPPLFGQHVFSLFYYHRDCVKCITGLPMMSAISEYGVYNPTRTQLYILPPWFIQAYNLQFTQIAEISYQYPLQGTAYVIGVVRKPSPLKVRAF